MSDPQFNELTVLDLVEVLPESGVLQVRHEHRVRRDGVVVARDFIRSAYAPGDDLSAADPLVQQLAALVQTPALVEETRARKQAEEAQRAHDKAVAEAHQRKVDELLARLERIQDEDERNELRRELGSDR